MLDLEPLRVSIYIHTRAYLYIHKLHIYVIVQISLDVTKPLSIEPSTAF